MKVAVENLQLSVGSFAENGFYSVHEGVAGVHHDTVDGELCAISTKASRHLATSSPFSVFTFPMSSGTNEFDMRQSAIRSRSLLFSPTASEPVFTRTDAPSTRVAQPLWRFLNVRSRWRYNVDKVPSR
jgi:hypothetical protein